MPIPNFEKQLNQAQPKASPNPIAYSNLTKGDIPNEVVALASKEFATVKTLR